jgi:quercetin dioxygenase-like cupin family protein
MSIAFRRGLAAAAALAGIAFAPAAFAGSCPADKMIADSTKPVTHKPHAVTDKLLAAIDLSKEKVALKGHMFRMRKLEIKPGGIVPWHSHAERPALIYIVQGTVVEYASNCAVPIVHKAGDVSTETAGVSHWWKNTGTQTVILISADILADPNDKNM